MELLELKTSCRIMCFEKGYHRPNVDRLRLRIIFRTASLHIPLVSLNIT